ncbi:hypothetical protein SAMN04487939_103132 [Lysobacter sp. yr284]|uniref:hypothetical protein n=1 Tax=Lysobacter sp. yr284 TaxID=1761791 RepID=UPI00089AA2C7|nr:hypothetical protein [Lysobacter sp. yr284]SDY54992.1 hypothetical protein SAMN04487939_103132 [Lysobacter sp. yr284]
MSARTAVSYRPPRRLALALPLMLAALPAPARASDHLDSPTVIADPRADIGDLYAWMQPDGRRLNLAMTVVGHGFSDRLRYVFRIDSARRFGGADASVEIVCRVPAAERVECSADGIDAARGDARGEAGLWGERHRLRVFAGLRDDPFYNNVRGTRAAYQVAAAALAAGAPLDAARCARFEPATVRAIAEQWRHTDGDPARNFLAGWTPAALVVQIERKAVDRGGPLLAVWAAVESSERRIDRAGRVLTGNALLGTLDGEEASDRLKERYNAGAPADGAEFAPQIERGLALYDAFDGRCGNALLAASEPARRYRALARLLADDRLWVDSRRRRCQRPFAVELAQAAGRRADRGDCGGRTPLQAAINVYRSLLVDASVDGVSDGLQRDEKTPSVDRFPFLAPADAAGYSP